MTQETEDRQAIIHALVECLNQTGFLNTERLRDATKERRAQFMQTKRAIRIELQNLIERNDHVE